MTQNGPIPTEKAQSSGEKTYFDGLVERLQGPASETVQPTTPAADTTPGAILRTRVASFTPARGASEAALAPATCEQCGITIPGSSRVCHVCGAPRKDALPDGTRIATAAPDLHSLQKTYDFRAGAARNTVTPPPEPVNPPAPAAFAEYQFGDNVREERLAEEPARNYRPLVIAVGTALVLILLAAVGWRERDRARTAAASVKARVSREWSSINHQQPPAVPNAVVLPKTKASAHVKKHSAAPPSPAKAPVVTATETEAPKARMWVDVTPTATSQVWGPVLVPAALSPMRIEISPRESLALLLYQVPPIYPAAARESHIEGTVVLKAVISKNGDVTELNVVSGHPMLVDAALEAVHKWQYRPYSIYGIPQEVQTTIIVEFYLARTPRPVAARY